MRAHLLGSCWASLCPILGLLLLAVVAVLPARTSAFDKASTSAAFAAASATTMPGLPSVTSPSVGVTEKPPVFGSLQFLKSAELVVPEQLRVLIFAPHPDDETLAAAGLIQRVQSLGGKVRVVFVTNGDGYVDGVRHEARRQSTSARDFIAYGERRRGEALKAITRFGLRADDAVFLGFPDDGIDDLWGRHWSEKAPFESPHTRLARPFEATKATRYADYAGVDLESEMERAIRDWRADWLVVPDPRDRHPDHCTSGVFVLDVVRRLHRKSHDGKRVPRVYTYLVHSPDYPASPTWVNEVVHAGVGGTSTASAALASARWSNLLLTAAEVERKQAALSEYESQMHVMSPFLKQFLTQFELFAELDTQQVDAVAGDYAARFGRMR